MDFQDQRKTLKIVLMLFCMMLTSPSFAEVSPFGSVSPGVMGKAISSTPTLTTKPGQSFAPKVAPPAAINPEAAKIYFVLNRVVITGNTAFSTEELQAIFAPKIKHRISVMDFQKLVQAVTDKYQKAGYFLSKAIIPPQHIKNGVVKVTIIEGMISDIKVQGLKDPKLIRYIQKYGERIRWRQPIKLKDVERMLLLVNDTASFDVRSVLAPDPSTPMGSTLTFVMEYTPLTLNLTQDNYQTRYLGPDETTLFSTLNSVIIPGGTLYSRILNGDEQRRIQFYELRHDQTIGTNGWMFNLDAWSTSTNPGFILTPLEIIGVSDDINATLGYPLIRSRARTLSVFGQFEVMNNWSNALDQLLYFDRIRDVTLGAQYQGTFLKGLDNLNLILSRGLNIWNADEPTPHSRFGVTPDFFKMVGTYSRTQPLTKRLSAFALVTAQYANTILPIAETFIFGGPYLGRGYDWAQFTGDKGVAGKAELHLNVEFPHFKDLNNIQFYGFYDAGALWSNIRFIPRVSGASIGLGGRTFVRKHFSVDGFIGKPLTFPNATQIIEGRSGHAFQAYFQASAWL